VIRRQDKSKIYRRCEMNQRFIKL